MSTNAEGMLDLEQLSSLVDSDDVETVLVVFPDLYGRFGGCRQDGRDRTTGAKRVRRIHQRIYSAENKMGWIGHDHEIREQFKITGTLFDPYDPGDLIHNSA